MNEKILRFHKKISLFIAGLRGLWLLVWREKLDEFSEMHIRDIVSDMRQNHYLLERELCLFLIEYQKKFRDKKERAVRVYYSVGNPFKEEIEKKIRELQHEMPSQQMKKEVK